MSAMLAGYSTSESETSCGLSDAVKGLEKQYADLLNKQKEVERLRREANTADLELSNMTISYGRQLALVNARSMEGLSLSTKRDLRRDKPASEEKI